MILPADTARCPGRALLVNSRPSTDPQCEGCQRLIAGRAETAQWIADGRPRVDGGKPAMPWLMRRGKLSPSAWQLETA